MYQNYNLSHRDALKILGVIQSELEKAQKGAAIAVVDSHGELIAFLRTDNCRVSVINIAINKAYTAARECKESAAVGDAAREKRFSLTNFGDLHYTGWGAVFRFAIRARSSVPLV